MLLLRVNRKSWLAVVFAPNWKYRRSNMDAPYRVRKQPPRTS